MGQLIGHLHVDVIRRNGGFAGPAGFYDLGQFLGDIYAESVGPPFLKPSRELVAGVMIHNVDIELTVLPKTTKT